MDTAPHTTHPPLAESVSADVCVVGGGILGLMTAALLKRAGMTVAVLEADRVATGVTGYTTAKVTVLHGLVYDEVRSHFGADGARHYAEANSAGLELIADWVAEGGTSGAVPRTRTRSRTTISISCARRSTRRRLRGWTPSWSGRSTCPGRSPARCDSTARRSSIRAASCSRSPPSSTAAGRTCSSARA
jgi:hypothetical protein